MTMCLFRTLCNLHILRLPIARSVVGYHTQGSTTHDISICLHYSLLILMRHSRSSTWLISNIVFLLLYSLRVSRVIKNKHSTQFVSFLTSATGLSGSSRNPEERTGSVPARNYYPRESFREDYVITGVRLSVCLSVCLSVTTITK